MIQQQAENAALANPTIEPGESVGQIAARIPSSYRVFMKYNIDFCCGGVQPLAEAAKQAALPAERLIEEILEGASSVSEEHVDWREKSSLEIISFIVDHYHRPLRNALPRLIELGEKVLKAHGEKHGTILTGLNRTVLQLSQELTAHMEKEEKILFPAILAAGTISLEKPVAVMIAEHQDAGDALDRIRLLTDDFQPPEDACNTFRAYWQELASLEAELMKHIHLENNILFPRVMAA